MFQGEAGAEGPVDQAAIESQVETIKSEKVSSQVIKKLDLTHDPEFIAPTPSLTGRIFGLFFGLFDRLFTVADQKGGKSPPIRPRIA